jgi:hypothetical protein
MNDSRPPADRLGRCNLVAPRYVRTTSFQRTLETRNVVSQAALLVEHPGARAARADLRECGMPVADHKDWCSIRRGQAEMERRKAER